MILSMAVVMGEGRRRRGRAAATRTAYSSAGCTLQMQVRVMM